MAKVRIKSLNLIFSLFVIIYLSNCYLCDDWEYILVRDLLKGYDSSIRPSLHHNATLNVTFGLALAQLIDVDERNMIITSNCWLNQGWIDYKLQWDPDQYDGIQFIHIPAEKIWRPDILLVNNADSWAKISSISTNAIVKYNGNVTWLSTVIFKSSCSIHVRYFPFDEQSCDMIFASWTFDGFFLDINVNSGEGDVTNYIKNGEWHLVKLMATKYLKKYSCCEEPYPEVYYRLIIRRRPLYYVFNMVFPCMLITLVAFLGFYLPPDSSEKVSIGITTLLSLTVFLMLVAESMPPTSEQLPLLGIYYAVTISIVSFSTAMAVITLNINNKGSKGKRVPRLIRIIFFKYLAKILGTNLSTESRKRNARLLKAKNKYDSQSGSFQNENSKQNKFENENFLYKNELNGAKRAQHTKVNCSKCDCSSTKEHSKKSTSLDLAEHDLKQIHKLDGLILESSDDYFNIEQPQAKLKASMAQFDSEDKNSFSLNSAEDSSINTSTKNNEKQKTVNFDKILVRPTSILKNYDATSETPSKQVNEANPKFDSVSFNLSTPLSPSCQLHCICECSNNSFIMGESRLANNSCSSQLASRLSKASEHESELLAMKRIDSCLKFRRCSNLTGGGTPSANISPKHMINQSSANKLNMQKYEFLYELERILDKQFSPLIGCLMVTVEKNEERLNEKEKCEDIQGEWTDVALVSDHFLCYFFPFLTLVTCLFIFLNSPHVFSNW